MAIPFNLPSDEETEDSYRRLDQLLLDLYNVLRQILLRRSSETGGAEGRAAPSGSRPVGDVTRHRLDPGLPDVVSSTLDCPCATRRRRRRRRRDCCRGEQGQRNQTTRENQRNQTRENQRSQTTASVARVSRPSVQEPRRENWLEVGEHLRKIAEEFRTLRKEEDQKEKDQNLQLQVKTSGLFSLLVPSHFRHSLWTTVILLVGWRILVRTR